MTAFELAVLQPSVFPFPTFQDRPLLGCLSAPVRRKVTCEYLQSVKIIIGQLMRAKREPLAVCRLALTAGAARRRELWGGELGGKHKSWYSNCRMQMQGAETQGVYCSPRCDSWLRGPECLPAECGTAVGVCLNRGAASCCWAFVSPYSPKFARSNALWLKAGRA